MLLASQVTSEVQFQNPASKRATVFSPFLQGFWGQQFPADASRNNLIEFKLPVWNKLAFNLDLRVAVVSIVLVLAWKKNLQLKKNTATKQAVWIFKVLCKGMSYFKYNFCLAFNQLKLNAENSHSCGTVRLCATLLNHWRLNYVLPAFRLNIIYHKGLGVKYSWQKL